MRNVSTFVLIFLQLILDFHISEVKCEILFDLNHLLADFEFCNINVLLLESHIVLTNFEYPVSISTHFQTHTRQSFGKLSRSMVKVSDSETPYVDVFAKHVLCAVQVFVLTKLETLVQQTVFGTEAEDIKFPNEHCPMIIAKATFAWTNCVGIIAGIDVETWKRYMTEYPYHFYAPMYWKPEQRNGISQAQYFVLFANLTPMRGGKVMEVEPKSKFKLSVTGSIYLCRMCWSLNDSLVSFQVRVSTF